MAAKKQYVRYRPPPGYTSRDEYHVNEEEYDNYLNAHEEELAQALRDQGYKVTRPREKALARAHVNAWHHYPRISKWNLYVKNNIHRVMAEEGVSAKDALTTLGREYKALYPKPQKRVAAGISGGARPRRRAPLLRM
jgi:hypothetical protein